MRGSQQYGDNPRQHNDGRKSRAGVAPPGRVLTVYAPAGSEPCFLSTYQDGLPAGRFDTHAEATHHVRVLDGHTTRRTEVRS